MIPRAYRWVMVLSAVATIAGVYLTSKLGLESDLAALLPSDFPSVQALDAMQAEVGGAVSKLRIVFKSSDFPGLLRLAHDLKPRLEESEEVLYAQFENEVDFYKKNALLLLSRAELDSLYDAVAQAIDDEKQKLNPFMIDDLFGPPPQEQDTEASDLAAWEATYSDSEPKPYFTNADSTVLVMEVAAAREGVDLDFSRQMLAAVQGIVSSAQPSRYAADVEVVYGGQHQETGSTNSRR